MNFIDKPYSPACDRNKAPILTILETHLRDAKREIGRAHV